METATKINRLKGLYTFESPYHQDKRKLPFNIIGNSFSDEYPLQVETVEYRGYTESKINTNYKIEVVEEYIKTGLLTKVKEPNLNMMFIDQIRNFSHLVTIEPKTKTEFLDMIKKTYDTMNPKTQLFFQATQKSQFETIRLNETRTSILFNQ